MFVCIVMDYYKLGKFYRVHTDTLKKKMKTLFILEHLELIRLLA